MSRVLVLMLIAAAGTTLMCNRSQLSTPETPSDISTQIKGEQFLLNAQDFDLQQVIALIRDNKLKDANDLEKRLNERSGINNVDLDHDGIIDSIKIKEGRNGNAVALEFLAVPSSTKNENDAVTVAKVDFSRRAGSNDVQIQGGYPKHVRGHETSFFSSMGSSLGQALFFSWLFMPSRPYYFGAMTPGYIAHPVIAQNDLSRARESYGKGQKAGSINKSSQPASFDAGSQKPKRSFSSIRGQAGPKVFEARSVQNPPPRASSFNRPMRAPMRGFRRR